MNCPHERRVYRCDCHGWACDACNPHADESELKTFVVTFTASVSAAVEATDKQAAIDRIRWHEGESFAQEIDDEPSIMTISGLSFTERDSVFEVIEP